MPKRASPELPNAPVVNRRRMSEQTPDEKPGLREEVPC
jgi:hypothetical protein